MSHAREMLESAPTEVTLEIGEVVAAIDACLDASQACTTCVDESLAEQDCGGLRLCIALCESCADVCTGTARALSRPSHWDHAVVNELLRACLRTCTSCAEECERHAQHHRHCGICAKVCRACEHACTELLETEALQQLEKLAGG